ncbi:MAG: EamA family transporter [Candidatus Omnitrophica bacterium]|nr:EamA family transporter [Candidatus Omnitrophota bacterium]
MIKLVVLVLIAEIFTALGQLFLKKGVDSSSFNGKEHLNDPAGFAWDILSKPVIWVGVVLMATGLVSWLVALGRADLNLVFTLGSLQYLLIMILAHFYLGEKINILKLTGTLLVMAGMILAAAG